MEAKDHNKLRSVIIAPKRVVGTNNKHSWRVPVYNFIARRFDPAHADPSVIDARF